MRDLVVRLHRESRNRTRISPVEIPHPVGVRDDMRGGSMGNTRRWEHHIHVRISDQEYESVIPNPLLFKGVRDLFSAPVVCCASMGSGRGIARSDKCAQVLASADKSRQDQAVPNLMSRLRKEARNRTRICMVEIPARIDYSRDNRICRRSD